MGASGETGNKKILCAGFFWESGSCEPRKEATQSYVERQLIQSDCTANKDLVRISV